MRLGRVVGVALALFVYLSPININQGDYLIIHFLNVGQGDAMLLELTGGQQVLIDSGPYQNVVYELDAVMPIGDRRLEAVLISHADDDHVSGLVSVLDRYKVDALYMSSTDRKTITLQALQERLSEMSMVPLWRGDMLEIGRASLRCLWPEEGLFKEGNDGSQVMWLEYGYFSAVLSGDAPAEVLEAIMPQESIDLLKVSHHGARDGTSSRLLHLIEPKLAVISSGHDNRYGHPSPETLQLLEDNGTHILRTDQQGMITVKINGAGYSVYPVKR